jgi:hypothetical protein
MTRPWHQSAHWPGYRTAAFFISLDRRKGSQQSCSLLPSVRITQPCWRRWHAIPMRRPVSKHWLQRILGGWWKTVGMPNSCSSSRARNGWWISARNNSWRTRPFGMEWQAGSIRSWHRALCVRCRFLSSSARLLVRRRSSVERGCQVVTATIHKDMPRSSHNAQFDLSSFCSVEMIVDARMQHPTGCLSAHETSCDAKSPAIPKFGIHACRTGNAPVERSSKGWKYDPQ